MEILTTEHIAGLEKFMLMQAERIEAQHKEIISLRNDRWMSVPEVAQYTGFGHKWVVMRKEKIGYYQEGKDIKFKKSNVDAYMKRNSTRPKIS